MIQPSLVHTYIIFFKLDQKKVREEHKTNYLGIQADKMNKKKKKAILAQKKRPSTLVPYCNCLILVFIFFYLFSSRVACRIPEMSIPVNPALQL